MSSAHSVRRAETWEVEQDGEDGEFEVRQGRKRHRSFTSERLALDYVASNRQPHQQVFVVEPDGYRVNVTRRFDRAPKTR